MRSTDIGYDCDYPAGTRIDDDKLIADNDVVVAPVAAEMGETQATAILVLSITAQTF